MFDWLLLLSGVVVEDCLLLLLNLLKNNVSNQNFLKEGSYIQRLPIYFDLKQSDKSPSNDGWSAQKVSNVHLMLQVCWTESWIYFTKLNFTVRILRCSRIQFQLSCVFRRICLHVLWGIPDQLMNARTALILISLFAAVTSERTERGILYQHLSVAI